MIQVTGVSKTFREGLRGRKVQALRDLSLHVRQGEVFGFLGPNGAGKSTTIKMLLNFIRPDRGTVLLAGRDVADPKVRYNVGYLPENPYFYDHLSAMELLWFGARASGVAPADVEPRSLELLRKVDLFDARDRRLRTYSKGMVQRAGLAAALIHDPGIVILDEPMSGLDPIGRKMVADLILSLKQQGKTVFFSTHILADVERVCDRVGIVSQGVLRMVGDLAEIRQGGRSLEDLFMEVAGMKGGAS